MKQRIKWLNTLLAAGAITIGVITPTAAAYASESANVQTQSVAALAATQTCTNNTGNTYASWSTSRTYTYTKGTYCIQTGGYRMVWQSDGNLVLYYGQPANARVAWNSQTSGTGNTLVFQTDGNVVIRAVGGAAKWNSQTSGTNCNSVNAGEYEGGILINSPSNQGLLQFRGCKAKLWQSPLFVP